MTNVEYDPEKVDVDKIIAALSTKRGASNAELAELTGWQPHTVRAAVSRLRKRGHTIERTPAKTGGSRYRLVKPS